MNIEVNGKTLETDEEGYLANINDWEPEVATVMAQIDRKKIWNPKQFFEAKRQEQFIRLLAWASFTGARRVAAVASTRAQAPADGMSINAPEPAPALAS